MFICPVCGYEMREHPSCGNICSCCGTEFELDDDEKSHEQLRAEWVAGGCRWWSIATLPPENWDAAWQLERLTPAPPLTGKDEG